MIRALRRCLFAALLPGALLAALGPPRPAGAQQAVELELLLAVDSSSSVDRREFDLQMQGIARAFRHPDVAAALQAAGARGVAVGLLQWSGSKRQTLAVDWMRVDDRAGARAFADRVARTARLVLSGGTSIGMALETAAAELERNGFRGQRRVIDVSGDGRANMGPRPALARDRAVARGITINGLAILNEEWALDRYYLDNVIGGTGAFIMTADDYEDFARAIKQKLVREIAGAPVARAPGPARMQATLQPPARPDLATRNGSASP